MAVIQVKLRDSVHNALIECARGSGIGVERVAATAIEGYVFRTLEEDGYIQRRAARGSLEAFRRALAQVPHGPPVPGDELE